MAIMAVDRTIPAGDIRAEGIAVAGTVAGDIVAEADTRDRQISSACPGIGSTISLPGSAAFSVS